MSDQPATSGRIGILGGTFDPVHLGHITSAEQIARAFQLDFVLLVLSARPPHKGERAHARAEDRMTMLRLATAGHPELVACDLEATRAGPSYTVDTLRELRRVYPKTEMFVIIGIDAWSDVDTWKRPEDLLALAHVIVTSRPGLDFPDTGVVPPVVARAECWYDPTIQSYHHKSGHRLIAHPIEGINASSTDIRHRARQGESLKGLVPDTVTDFIQTKGVYA